MENVGNIKKIAAAIAFSNRLKDVLKEVKRFKLAFNAEAHLIHIGERSIQKESELKENLIAIGLNPEEIIVEWKDEDVLDTIIFYCDSNKIDLLILGALDKEGILKIFRGSLARQISRKANCNVLLLLYKQGKERKFKRLMVDTVEYPKAKAVIELAKSLTNHLKFEELFLIKEVHHPALSYSISDSTAPETSKLKTELLDEDVSFLNTLSHEFEQDNLKVIPKTVQGKPGYAISKYAKTKKADLLIINAPEKQFGILDRLFTHDLEYVLAELPCNTLIVKSKQEVVE